jgi:phosphoglycerate kinase
MLLSHLGRPDGKINSAFSLKPIIPVIEDHLKRKITFIDNCVGIDAMDKAINLRN